MSISLAWAGPLSPCRLEESSIKVSGSLSSCSVITGSDFISPEEVYPKKEYKANVRNISDINREEEEIILTNTNASALQIPTTAIRSDNSNSFTSIYQSLKQVSL